MVSDACLLVASVFKKEKIVVVTHDQLCVNGLLKIEKHRFFFDVFLCFSVFFLCFFDFLFLFCKTMCDPTLADLTHCLVSVIDEVGPRSGCSGRWLSVCLDHGGWCAGGCRRKVGRSDLGVS